MTADLLTLVELASRDALGADIKRSTWIRVADGRFVQQPGSRPTTAAKMMKALAQHGLVEVMSFDYKPPHWLVVGTKNAAGRSVCWNFETAMPRAHYDSMVSAVNGQTGLRDSTPPAVQTNADLGRGNGRV